MRQRRLQIEVDRAQLRELFPALLAGRYRRQALLGAAAVLLEVARHQCLDGNPIGRVDIAPVDQELCQRPQLVARPCLKRRDELDLVDQAVLKG